MIDRWWLGLIELLVTFGGAVIALLIYSARLKRELRRDKEQAGGSLDCPER